MSDQRDHNTKSTAPAGLAALTLYLAAAWGFLGPALASGGATVLGHPESDVWKHLWGAWWMRTELAAGRFPAWTDLQNFPSGGSLYVIDPLNALLSAPLQGALGLVQAYNAVLAFQVVAAAMAAWALARWLTGDSRAALVAGTAYGFSPFLLTSGVSSGIAETANLAWLPLAILGLLMGLTGRGGVAYAVAGLALAAFGSWYYGMTAAVFGLLLGLWTWWRGRAPVPDPPERTVWTVPVTACVVAMVLVLPFAVQFARSMRGDDSLLARIDVTERLSSDSLEFLHRSGGFKNDADLLSYVMPGKAWVSNADDVDRRLKSVYVGWLVLLLAGVGLWKGGGWARFWALAGGVMLLLSIGPFLFVTPTVGLPGAWNPVYMLAYNLVPGFRLMHIVGRLSIAVQLCACVLAAVGLARVLPRGATGWLLAVGASTLVLAEVALLSPVPWPIPTASAAIPPEVRSLAEKPGRKGVIVLPLNREQYSLQPGEYYFWQSVHGKPMPITLTTRFPTEMMEHPLVGALYLCEDPAYGDPPPPDALRPGLASLREAGFGWFMVETSLMRPESAAKVEKALTGLLGKPERFEGGGLLYSL